MTDAPQKTLDELAAEIRTLTGVTDDDLRRRRHLNICNAQHHASNCAVCAKKLKSDQPVWRPRVLNPWGNYWTAPICKRCKDTDVWLRPFEKPKPCGGCGRSVYNERRYDSWRRRVTFCCDDCRSKAVSAIAQQRRTTARGKRDCNQCGETFEPTRSDSQFCSNACRQKTYRGRVTDSKPRARRYRKSRNGDRREVRA